MPVKKKSKLIASPHFSEKKSIHLKVFEPPSASQLKYLRQIRKGAASGKFLGPRDCSSCTNAISGISETLGKTSMLMDISESTVLNTHLIKGPGSLNTKFFPYKAVLPQAVQGPLPVCRSCANVSLTLVPGQCLLNAFVGSTKGLRPQVLVKVSAPGMVLNILAKKIPFLEYPGILQTKAMRT